MKKPLKRPISTPIANTINKVVIPFKYNPDASELVPAKYAVTTADKAITDSVDKSISPLIIHIPPAIARIPTKTECKSMFL
ncbi:hypothetical protein ES705_48978 [subsurface metagenome]